MIELPKILNKAELARKLYPDNSNAPANLNNKLNGSNRQSFTEADRKQILIILEETKKQIADLEI